MEFKIQLTQKEEKHFDRLVKECFLEVLEDVCYDLVRSAVTSQSVEGKIQAEVNRLVEDQEFISKMVAERVKRMI